MSVNIPLWVIGANVTAFTLSPCTISSVGAVAVNSALSLQGRWQEFQVNPKYELKEIASADQFTKTKVPVTANMMVTIKEIEQLAAGAESDTNALQNLFNGSRIVQLVVTRGIQGSGLKTWTAYLVIEEFEMSGQREEFIDTMSFQLQSVYNSGADVSLALS